VSGDKGLSLEIELRGASAGLWYDFSTEEGGDLINLYRSWRGYSGIAHFELSLQEIAKDFLGDPIEFNRPNWNPTPAEKITTDKKKFGTKPADDEPLGAPIATYQYKNADGSINTIVTRHEPKTFRPRCFKMIDGEMKWAPGMPESNRPLYHLPQIAHATEVVLVEGEGKADALTLTLDIVTTSIMGGSNERAVEKTDLTPLVGKTIRIWPDNDAPGRKYADHIAGKLLAIGCKVWMVPIPSGKPEKWDAADCIKEGGDPAAILASAVEMKSARKPDPEPEPKPKRFKYSNIRQIKGRSDPVWMIDGLVSEQTLGFIYGAPSSLKTFTALDIALCLATGQGQWWERDLRCHGAVIYICSEGTARFKDRIRAWEQHRGVSADDVPFYLFEETINFMSVDDIFTLSATVEDIAASINGPIAAVFVDTVSKVLPGARENLQEDMSLFVEACTAVRQHFKTVVFGLHHTNKDGGFRGSTVMPGAGDFIILAKREPGAMTGSIFVHKVRDGEDGWELHFKATKIELGEGNTSLVVDPVGAPPKGSGSNWPSRAICKEILAELDAAWKKGAPWIYSNNTARSARRMIEAKWKTRKGVATRILDSWMANGIIEHAERDAKRHVWGYRKVIDL